MSKAWSMIYRLTPEGLWFGSEAKAILQDPAVPRVADRLALHEYLTYGYVPTPGTFYRGIRALPPVHPRPSAMLRTTDVAARRT